MYNIGDKIKIVGVDPSANMQHYIGKTGEITHISKDPWGSTCLYGTWGGCSLHIGEDELEKINDDN